MRRTLVCVLMTSLLLLTGCAGGGGVSDAEQEALLIRSEYLEGETFTARVHLVADYGQRVYEYGLDASVNGEETLLTVTAPETVAGVTARMKQDGSLLEYENLVLETGPLDERGLTPVSALPVLLEEARSGFIHTCSYTEEGELRVDCTDPEQEPGQGRSSSLWFDRETHSLVKGELSLDGYRMILCEFTDFTME